MAHSVSKGVETHILNFGPRRGWVVNFTPRPVYRREYLLYQLNKGLGGPYRKSRRFREEKQFLPLARFETRAFHPVAYATPAPINTLSYLSQYDAHFLFHNFVRFLFYSKFFF